MWEKATSALMLLKLEMCLTEPHKAQEIKGKKAKKEKGAKVGKKNTYNLHAHVPRSKPRVDHTPYVQVLL